MPAHPFWANAARTALLMPALLGACGASGGSMQKATTTVHGTVLELAVPHDLEATPIGGGLMIRPRDAAGQRRIYEMAVTVAGTADRRDDGAPPLDQVRGHGAKVIHYSVARADGGSGGEEVTLLAARACDRATVHLRFDAQGADGEEVDLAPAFAVLESARCTPAV